MTTAREVGAPPRYEFRDEPLRDHWQWRPEWSVDRPCLLWYLTFENQPRLWRLAEQLQDRLDGMEAVDPVPPPWLHLTLEDIAFMDEIAPAQVDELVEVAEAAVEGWSAPPLTLGPVAAWGSALVLLAGPGPALRDLRDRLRACTAVVVGSEKVRGPEHFVPHVSFGYVNRHCPRLPVLERLEDLADENVVVSVPRLTLAAVTRRNRHYQWIARASLDLSVGTAVGQPAH